MLCLTSGYDGDSSDGDEDGASMMSFSDARPRSPLLPDFWLVLKLHIDQDSVHVYFHAR